MKSYSHTRLSLFEACPYCYRLRYIDKKEPEPSESLLIGRLLHEIIGKYNKHLLGKKVQTDITVIPEITENLLYSPKGDFAGLAPEKANEVLSIATKFSESHVLDLSRVVDVETMNFFVIPQGKFWFVIDLLMIENSKAEIVDYKSDWNLRSQADVDKDPQLQTYAMCVNKKYPQVEEFDVKLNFIRHSVVRETHLDLEDVGSRERQIMKEIEQIEGTRAFKPTPGANCSWCDFSELCPLDLEGQAIIQNEPDAQSIAGEILVLEKKVKDRKDVLSQFCAKGGPVDVNGERFNHFKTESEGFPDVRSFMRVLENHGKDPFELLRVDGKQVKTLWGESTELDTELEKISADRSYTRFSHKKIK